ncbi:MAG: hypothetical protein QOJ24_1179 [Mycobacterium sp.]|jgi:hypothetical protein|nr:hypothetical protein [Mycobacterium sp.]
MRSWATALNERRDDIACNGRCARGRLAADSWELTVQEIHRWAPELTVLAPDLPGRRNKPGDLWAMTIGKFVDSLVGDIESARVGGHR